MGRSNFSRALVGACPLEDAADGSRRASVSWVDAGITKSRRPWEIGNHMVFDKKKAPNKST